MNFVYWSTTKHNTDTDLDSVLTSNPGVYRSFPLWVQTLKLNLCKDPPNKQTRFKGSWKCPLALAHKKFINICLVTKVLRYSYHCRDISTADTYFVIQYEILLQIYLFTIWYSFCVLFAVIIFSRYYTLMLLNLVFNDMTNHIMLRTAANGARRHTAQSHNRANTTQTCTHRGGITRSRLLS